MYYHCPFQLTEIADQLLQRGEVNIYEQTYEELQVYYHFLIWPFYFLYLTLQPPHNNCQNNVNKTRSVAFSIKDKKHATSSDITATSGVKFEYRGRDGQIHGPYPLHQVRFGIIDCLFNPSACHTLPRNMLDIDLIIAHLCRCSSGWQQNTSLAIMS